MYFCIRNDIIAYGKDKIIFCRQGFEERIWSDSGRPRHEVWRRTMLREESEQGKASLRMDKVNQLLDLFNYELTATKKAAIEREQSDAHISSAEREQARPKARPKVKV